MPRAKRLRRARGSFTPSFRGGALRLGLFVSALIVVVAGAAWSKHWLLRKPEVKKGSVGLLVVGCKEQATAAGNPASPQVHSETSNTKVASDVPVASANMPTGSVAPVNPLPVKPKDAVASSTQSLASNNSRVQAAGKKTPPSSGLAANPSTVRPTAKATSDSIAAAAGESGIVPPKLIKSAPALAPIEALRNFDTGNVVVDAVGGTTGEGKLVSKLSGPPSPRSPALAPLQEHRYEP